MASATSAPADPTEVVGRRAAAFLIDAILLGLIGLVVFAALRYRSYSGVQVNACSVLSKTTSNAICVKLGSRVFLWHAGAAKLAVLVTLFFGFLNGVVLQSIKGATVGKICFRLSVVDAEGTKPGLLQMFGRWAFLLVDVGFCFIGGFIALATHPHRRIGDYALGTYVVGLRSVGLPIVMEIANDATGVGVPANWQAPPVPAPAAKAGVVAGAAAAPLHTPPGTAPTTPGEWGAVARSAPVVRSPQWAAPPPSDTKTPAVTIESSTSPKWAAPPVAPESEKDDKEDAKEDKAKDGAKDDDAKREMKGDDVEDADVEDDAVTEDAKPAATADDTKTEDAKAEDAKTDSAKPEPAKAAAKPPAKAVTKNAPKHTRPPAAKKPEPKAEPAEDAEPEKVAANGAEPKTDSTAGDTDATSEADAVPELSEWSPVGKSRRGRTTKASTQSEKDASWWEAALSGDAESEAEAGD